MESQHSHAAHWFCRFVHWLRTSFGDHTCNKIIIQWFFFWNFLTINAEESLVEFVGKWTSARIRTSCNYKSKRKVQKMKLKATWKDLITCKIKWCTSLSWAAKQIQDQQKGRHGGPTDFWAHFLRPSAPEADLKVFQQASTNRNNFSCIKGLGPNGLFDHFGTNSRLIRNRCAWMHLQLVSGFLKPSSTEE